MADKEAVHRIAKELDAVCLRERRLGTSQKAIEIALLHCWEVHKPRDAESPPADTANRLQKCEECGAITDGGSRLCVGCDAYRDHTQ